MQSDYQLCEDKVLVYEGGYTNEKADPGGPTNWGITIYDARLYWKKDATAQDVQDMPKSVARDIYKTKYWNNVNGDNLPAGVDDAVFDYAVNSGWCRSGKVLRRLVSLPDTNWQVTDLVLEEVNKRDPIALINAICDERLKFLEGLAIWPEYGHGWSARVANVRQYATQLSTHRQTPVSSPAPPLPAPIPGPKAKGVHPVDTGPVVTGGGAATTVAAWLAHLLASHRPDAVLLAVVIGAAAIGVAIAYLQNRQAAKQEAPTPGILPVPVKVSP